jgi:release factor glutamine methyltransferase
MMNQNKYSYQDCWNYALSLRKNITVEEVKNDVIALCWTSPENFWSNFSYRLLNFAVYTAICRNLYRYLKENLSVPYLTKQVFFYGLLFYVKKGVFIPQKDTEILVEKTLEYAEKYWGGEKKLKVLDIGTGCGNIVISLAKNKPNWSLVGVDSSESALKVARINAGVCQIKNVRFFSSNLFACISTKEKFDVIVSNPPYLSIAEYKKLTNPIKEQPRKALVAKNNGYYFYQEIFRHSGFFLTKKSLLVVEVGYQQVETIIKLVINYFPQGKVSVFPDYSGNIRVIVVYKI